MFFGRPFLLSGIGRAARPEGMNHVPVTPLLLLALALPLGACASPPAGAAGSPRTVAEAWVRAQQDAAVPAAREPRAGTAHGASGPQRASDWDLWAGQPVSAGGLREVADGVTIRPMSSDGSAARLVADAAADAVRVGLPILRRRGARLTPGCGAGTVVQLYQWPEDRLPPERFEPGLELAANERLQGMYMSNAAAGGSEDVIVVLTADDATVQGVLVHELAHFLYQRTCGEARLAIGSEAYAQRVAGRAESAEACRPHALLRRNRCR